MHSKQIIHGEVVHVNLVRGEQVAVARGIRTAHDMRNDDHFELRPASFRPAEYEKSSVSQTLCFGTFEEAQALGGGTVLATGDLVVIEATGHNVLAWDIEPDYFAAMCAAARS